MNLIGVASIFLLLASGACAEDALVRSIPLRYQPLTPAQRWSLFAKDTFWSPMVLFRGAAGASIAQLRDEPPEWGQGGEGFGKRLAHRYGYSAVRKSCEAAGAALLRHDVRYQPSASSNFRARTLHALEANFVTLDRHGNRAFHATRLGSIVAAELVSRQWMPQRYRSVYSTTGGVAIQLGLGTAYDLLREFTPDLKRALRRK
jgi:hypothetical protein